MALLAATAAPLAAQGHTHGAQGGNHGAHHGGGAHAMPAGWQARLDREGSTDALHFMEMSGGFHVTTGPAAVFYNPANNVTGDFRARATFTQTKAPTHPEAYGLVIAGKDLGAAADYMYFIVRGDGKYMVRHRAPNGEVHTIVDWTESPALVKQDAAGKATNALAVEGGAFGVRFLANGQKVAEFLKADVPYLVTDGIVGLRVNHNLDVHVSDFAVERGGM
ncbi:MAG TPA: hypothetical protein VHG91_03280 [Longimicrobium sp.]|nr:hypothetical protein [Longimicrobium sp.]